MAAITSATSRVRKRSSSSSRWGRTGSSRSTTFASAQRATRTGSSLTATMSRATHFLIELMGPHRQQQEHYLGIRSARYEDGNLFCG
eukprot:2568909-Heterocapsa_arctica.AAC.1